MQEVQVDVGGETATAVTGAPNIELDMVDTQVAVARPGAILVTPETEEFSLYTVSPKPVSVPQPTRPR